MEQYCITLEQAKKLKELGFVQTARYWWVVYEGPFLSDYGSIINDAIEKYPAYHVGELGEILGDEVHQIEYNPVSHDWEFQGRRDEYICHSTEAQARGALLQHLLENKLI